MNPLTAAPIALTSQRFFYHAGAKARKQLRWLALLSLLALFVAIGAFLNWDRSRPGLQLAQSGPTAIDTAYAPDTILSSSDALSRSLQLFPPDTSVEASEARLISLYTFSVWETSSIVGDPTPGIDEYDWTDTDPQDPVWLVALVGQGLTVKAVLEAGSPAGSGGDIRAAQGAFYAWDANSGSLIAVGALMDAPLQDLQSIVALPNEPLTPVPATAYPTDELWTPLPTRTWSPEQIETAINHMTAIAGATP